MKTPCICLWLAAMAVAPFTLTGCGEEPDNAFEEAAQEVGEAADQAAQSIEHEAEEAGLATPDADDDTGPEDDL